MKMSDWESRLQGLKITLRLGDIVSINNGELLMQYRQRSGNQVTITFKSDPAKYNIRRKACEPSGAV